MPVNGKRLPLVLSLPDLPAYLRDTSYLGQLVGRYGNRIAGAAFELDGKRYSLTANNGANTLHGGAVGFGKYVWKVLGAGGGRMSYLKLGHRSPAGINGFPGNLDVTALISLFENTLTLAFEATT
jgi:aldose 1-epimerase